jgi:hypothetical protein
MTKFSVDISIDVGFGTAIRVLGLWSAIVFGGMGDLWECDQLMELDG